MVAGHRSADLGLVIALAVLMIFFAIRIPEQFYRPGNIISIGEGITLIGLTGLAETVVMIMGGWISPSVRWSVCVQRWRQSPCQRR